MAGLFTAKVLAEVVINSSTALTTIYTVPAGTTAYIKGSLVRNGNGGPAGNIFVNTAGTDQLIGTFPAGTSWDLFGPGNLILSAGDIIKAQALSVIAVDVLFVITGVEET